MNRFTLNSQYVLDASGHTWAVNQWHENPLPAGIEADKSAAGCKYWLVSVPLPPVPVEKTQEQLDEEARIKWCNSPKNSEWQTIGSVWHAACDHARKNP